MSDFQISLLKQCATGLNVKSLSAHEAETLLWLARKGLCGPQNGELSSIVYVLTPEGQSVLHQHELELYKEQKRDADQRRQHDEQISQANEDRKKQFKHDWMIAIYSSIVSFISGLIIEHFFNILSFLFPQW